VPRVQREAQVTWEGSVARGRGTISAATGAFRDLPYSLASRVGQAGGSTNPEELLAAAHAACYAMSLANELATAGPAPEQLEVHATVTLDEVEGGSHRIVSSDLFARARVKEADEEGLRRAADAANAGCPLSALIGASAVVTVSVKFEGGDDGD
jgi:lipoyl-dependent peroxiredoxin